MKLQFNCKIQMQDCYYDFISEYPDYAPKSKMTISRTKFNKWMVAYGKYIAGTNIKEGRNAQGKFIMIIKDDE